MHKIGDERMKGSLSLRGFRKLRTGAIVATGVFLIGLASIQTTVQASEEDGVWIARTVEQVKADIQKEDNFFKYEIKWGDTLSIISEATNIPVDVLKEMNRISDRNLFLPHNELLYTEGESVTDSKIKHKIVIKESYGNKEVRTYEVVLQKNHETAEVSFELKETTEKVQTSYTSVVCYGDVYNLVSEQVEDVTGMPTPAHPVETTPAGSGATETPTPAQPEEEQPAAPGATETPTPAPAQPAETTPAGSGITETPTPAQPVEATPAGSGATETPTPVQPTEEKPATSGTTKIPAPAQPAETTPEGSGTTETPTPAQPAETTPAGSGATETPTPAQPAETTPAGSGTTETPAPTKPAETTPAAPGVTETPSPTKPAEEQPAGSGATEMPAPTQPAEEQPVAPGTTETPAPTKPVEEQPAGSGATEIPAPTKPAEEQPAAPGAIETPALTKPAEEQPAAPGATETPAPTKPVEEQPAAPGTAETLTPAQPAETTPAGSGTTETPAPTKPAEEQPAAPGATETPTPAQPAEEKPATSGTTENPAPTKPTEDTPADSNNQNNPTEPKDDVEKGLEENNSELESRKNIKLEEIESSSLLSSEKEAAKLKVEEYTNKAKEAMKQAKTTDDQAAVVDNYSDDLATINTPGVDQGKPDYTNSGLSGNGPEGTHIGDNNAIGHGNSTPENTGFRNAPVYQPRVTRRERSVDEPKNKVSIYYNYDGMKDIPGFFNDLDSKNEVEVPQKAPAQTLKSILKSKIDQKKAELEKKGYKISDEYFVGIDQENATHYDYVVTFTKA